ncbi:hypothetical protein Tco_1094274 [Tanacetum coccineum]|uniref:Retrotransposon gag domain-containing protein n=1 Tax=Tanacetum coccineum TaxID=301880 RepID=A0ABQ5IGB0_9ASTR
MEQYLALSRDNQAPGVVKPEIGGNVNFEIKSQFMHELKEDTFSGNKDEDAHDHIDRVLSVVGLFNILGVSKDVVMLRVFPFTLTGAAKRWVDRLAPGTSNTWDLLKKAFIQMYCRPSKTAKLLEDIHNFKQEGDESLYQAWERHSRLCARARSVDDMPFRIRACMGYTVGEERFRICKQPGRQWWGALRLPILTNSRLPRVYICSHVKTGTAHEIDSPYVKDFTNLDGILRHFISLRNFSLTLTSVTSGDQVIGIFVNRGAIQILTSNFFGGM